MNLVSMAMAKPSAMKNFVIATRDVEAVEHFLLPLPGLYKVSHFRVCFHFQFSANSNPTESYH